MDPSSFLNRKAELADLDALSRRTGLVVIFGRRRVGKTRLLVEWLKRHGGLYSQAIEGSPSLQLAQVYLDLRENLKVQVEPRSWSELLSLLDQQDGRLVLCLDEFPYLVASDPTLPSTLQKWLDHRKKQDVLLVLAGSSTRMMHSTFLDATAPLYGRALKLLRIQPLGFPDLCRYFSLRGRKDRAFLLYSLVGGIPKYWEWLGVAAAGRPPDPVEAAGKLYFSPLGWMEEEPRRALADESIAGVGAPSVLEAIGRGAHRPSEIAGRLGIPQTSLSKLLQVLLDACLIVREIPFGTSERDAKRTLYRIGDPALRFWYSVYSPHRSRWSSYSRKVREELLADHGGTVYEDWVRSQFAGAGRYWESQAELDMVRDAAPSSRSKAEESTLIVTEIKRRKVSISEARSLATDLEARFRRTALARRPGRVRFEVIDASFLSRGGPVLTR
jgi:AAA+ ATPase superfamily predicted ATPase